MKHSKFVFETRSYTGASLYNNTKITTILLSSGLSTRQQDLRREYDDIYRMYYLFALVSKYLMALGSDAKWRSQSAYCLIRKSMNHIKNINKYATCDVNRKQPHCKIYLDITLLLSFGRMRNNSPLGRCMMDNYGHILRTTNIIYAICMMWVYFVFKYAIKVRLKVQSAQQLSELTSRSTQSRLLSRYIHDTARTVCWASLFTSRNALHVYTVYAL